MPPFLERPLYGDDGRQITVYIKLVWVQHVQQIDCPYRRRSQRETLSFDVPCRQPHLPRTRLHGAISRFRWHDAETGFRHGVSHEHLQHYEGNSKVEGHWAEYGG